MFHLICSCQVSWCSEQSAGGDDGGDDVSVSHVDDDGSFLQLTNSLMQNLGTLYYARLGSLLHYNDAWFHLMNLERLVWV